MVLGRSRYKVDKVPVLHLEIFSRGGNSGVSQNLEGQSIKLLWNFN